MVVLAACGLGACSNGGGTGGRDSSQEAAVLADSAPESAISRTGGSAAGDSYHGAAVVADSTALALVAEYLRRDAQGEFMGPSEWADENVIGFMGSDYYSIVSDYKILAAETRDDTTRVTVQYDVIGGFWLDEDLQPVRTFTDSVELYSFVVLRSDEGMRLADILPAIHMSGRAVLEQGIGLDEEYRRALTEAIRRKGGTPPDDP
jgi:hypothetical protein